MKATYQKDNGSLIDGELFVSSKTAHAIFIQLTFHDTESDGTFVKRKLIIREDTIPELLEHIQIMLEHAKNPDST